MEYYSLLKRNELSSHKKIWRNLKYISLRERRPSEKAPKLFAILVLISLSARNIENTIIYYNGNM